MRLWTSRSREGRAASYLLLLISAITLSRSVKAAFNLSYAVLAWDPFRYEAATLLRDLIEHVSDLGVGCFRFVGVRRDADHANGAAVGQGLFEGLVVTKDGHEKI